MEVCRMKNEPNKSAKNTKSYTIASFYNEYLTDIESDTTYDVDYTTYRAIVTDYFKYLQQKLIEEGKMIKLPYRMGNLQVIKSKPKHLDKRSLRIDYQATKQYDKLILLDNQHSDGYKMRAWWNKIDMLVPNKSKYQLVLTRANKRRLAVIIKNRLIDFEEI